MKPIFESLYLRNAWCDLVEIGMWDTDNGGHLHSKNRPVSCKQHEVTYAQITLLFFLSIYSRAGFLGCMTHGSVS